MQSNPVKGELNAYRALDLGTRDGYGVQALAKLGCCHVEGVELVPETAAYAASRGRQVRQGDMQQLADASESWDLVTSIHSLEHCDQPRLALNEMVRVLLRPGGWLFLVVPREQEPSRSAAHNCAFPTMDAFKQFVLANPLLDGQSLRDSVGVLAHGCRELRVVVQKRVRRRGDQ